jgi:hypothetical protein
MNASKSLGQLIRHRFPFFSFSRFLNYVTGKCSLTPLLWAATNGHLEICTWLLEKGASMKAEDKVKKRESK